MATSNCTYALRRLGKSYPRTCTVCGLGPCREPEEKAHFDNLDPPKGKVLPVPKEEVSPGTMLPDDLALVGHAAHQAMLKIARDLRREIPDKHTADMADVAAATFARVYKQVSDFYLTAMLIAEKSKEPIFLDMKRATEANLLTPGTFINIDYTNHRNERRIRRVRPISFRTGKNEWHKRVQPLMLARDLETGHDREFAVSSVHAWGVPTTE